MILLPTPFHWMFVFLVHSVQFIIETELTCIQCRRLPVFPYTVPMKDGYELATFHFLEILAPRNIWSDLLNLGRVFTSSDWNFYIWILCTKVRKECKHHDLHNWKGVLVIHMDLVLLWFFNWNIFYPRGSERTDGAANLWKNTWKATSCQLLSHF